jgi:hypothetical protein
MRRPLTLPLLALLAVAACDGGTDQTTCLRATMSYAGAASGPAYVKVTGSDGNLYLAHQTGSIAALTANPPSICFASQGSGDVALTAIGWIDASGSAATAGCADLTADACAPAATDPQGSGASVLHAGESNEITVVVTDPAPPAGG